MKRCKCGNEQWDYYDLTSPIIFCDACDTEYDLETILDVYLQSLKVDQNE